MGDHSCKIACAQPCSFRHRYQLLADAEDDVRQLAAAGLQMPRAVHVHVIMTMPRVYVRIRNPAIVSYLFL